MKRASEVKQPDINIRDGIEGVLKLAKKEPDKELVNKSALAVTKAGEYLGVMDKLRNTPIFIFGAVIFYGYQIFRFIFHREKQNEPGGTDNDIRTEGNRKNKPGKNPNEKLQPNTNG